MKTTIPHASHEGQTISLLLNEPEADHEFKYWTTACPYWLFASMFVVREKV